MILLVILKHFMEMQAIDCTTFLWKLAGFAALNLVYVKNSAQRVNAPSKGSSEIRVPIRNKKLGN